MKAIKAILKISLCIFLVGLTLFLVLFGAAGWDPDVFSGVERTTTVHGIEGEIKNIYVDMSEADVTFAVGESDEIEVVCNESNKTRFIVTEAGGRLMIIEERAWYDQIFDRSSYSVVLYLPAGEYGELEIDGASSDVTVPSDFAFSSVEIDVTSGDVDFTADVSGSVDIEKVSGDARIAGCGLGSLSIDSTSGEIDVSDAVVVGNIEIESTSGDVTVINASFAEFSLESTSGELTIRGARGVNAYISHGSGETLLRDTVLSGRIIVESTSGNISLDSCDATSVDIDTTSGDVTATFLTPKTFDVDTTSGDKRVPYPSVGDPCRIRTTSGDVDILIVEKR